MTQQGLKQKSIRTETGRAETFDGDWHALFDKAGIPAGPFNGRQLAWINAKLSKSFTNLAEAQQALANAGGATNFSSLGEFDAGSGPPPDPTPAQFYFDPEDDADPSTSYESNEIELTDFDGSVALTVTDGEMNKNSAGWGSSALTAVEGDRVRVRRSSSALWSTSVAALLTAGPTSGAFTITTKDEPPPTPSDIISVTIMDSTALDATGDYGDATTRPGVNLNGCAVKIVTPWQLGHTFDCSKIFITYKLPGNDASGTTTVTHMVACTVELRRQYTAQASKQSAQVGGNLEVYCALPDIIYQAATDIEVVAAAGYYGPSAAGSVTTVVNNSTRTFYKSLTAWLNMQLDRATGSSYRVELAVADRSGRNGQMVARVEFTASDEHGNTTAVQTVTAPSLSTIQTQGNIAEVWAADIPLSSLTQGDICEVNARVFSWIGDASSVLDLSVDGEFFVTANPRTMLLFRNDKNSTWGGAIAYVRAGAGGTGVVSRTDATAKASPFATIALAFAALATFNNANSTPAHNDHSGSVIYLMDDGSGGAVAHTIAATISTAAGDCWTDIRPDPSATGAVSISMTATRSIPNLVRTFVDISHTAGNGFDGGSGGGEKMIAFAGGTITSTGGAPLGYRNGLIYLSNVTIIASADLNMMSGSATTRTQTALALGVIAESSSSDGRVLPFAMIGCRLKRLALQEQNPATVTSWDSQDGMFVYNNWFRDVRSAGTINALVNYREYEIGLALIQNLLETSGSGQTGLRLGGDNQVQPCDNVLVHYNTFAGGRLNVGYADVNGAVSILKRVQLCGNLGNDTLNIKTDTYTGSPAGTVTARGRVGNWELRLHIGNYGNVFASGSASGTSTATDGSTWLGEWADPSNRFNVGIANIHFTNDQSTPIGSGSLGGTYELTGSTNAAYDAIPTGFSKLRYDIMAGARNDNGTGAAGCYERAA